MSGDWSAKTEFGRLAFTIDPNGKSVTTMVVEISNYTCGGTTLTTQEQTLSLWPISAGEFSNTINLDPGRIEDLSLDGSYSHSDRRFSGTWEEDAYGTHCSGRWETPARK